MRPFLAAGVPADLTRAALRRAWSADPSIRDFIGLSENSWDFNAPHGVPGFGALTEEDAHRLAEVLKEPRDEEGSGASAAESQLPERDPMPAAPPAATMPDPGPHPERGDDTEPDPANPTLAGKQADAAAQHGTEVEQVARKARRRHGGALPV
jgi:hypothetical protein